MNIANAVLTYEIFAKNTPHYSCATAANVLLAMDEALRLEKVSGLVGAFMIRELRDGREHAVFPVKKETGE